MNAPLRFHALVQQAQNRDPTQTLMIRRRYEAEVNKRFRALKGAIRASIVDQDVFGLTQPRPFRPLGNADQTSFSPLPERAFQFSTMPEKVDGFMTWLEDQQSQGLLEISSRRQLGHAANSQWQNVYLQSAYQKGVSRARLEMQKAGVSMPIKDQGNIKESVSAAFNRPFHADRVGSIYARAYNELKGVTQAMDTAISRALSDGLLAGKGPLDIARDINKQVDGIGIARARLIARTETIRAHHVATIQEYRNAGVLGIKVKAEWLTAGDSRVCAECAALQGRVFTLDEIEPLIPLHPQCRCVALPVDVTDEEDATSLPVVPEAASEVSEALVTIDDLRVDTPEMKITWTTLFRSDEEAVEAWNRIVGVSPKMIESTFDELSRIIGEGPISVRIHHNNVRVRKSGGFGTVERVFRADVGADSLRTVEHSVLEVSPALQRTGAVKDFLASSIKLYQQIGVKEVALNANIDVGGYAWARYGWAPGDAQLWRILGRTLRSRLDNFSGDEVPSNVRDAVWKILDKPDPKSVWELADLNFEVDGERLGKKLLLGTNWDGVLRLDDKEAMDRFTNYIGRR